MILVLSFDCYEQGTDPVVDWLLYYNADFIKITLNDIIKGNICYKIDVTNRDIIVEGVSIKNQISVIWNRRFLSGIAGIRDYDGKHEKQLAVEINSELESFVNYLDYFFSEKIWMPQNLPKGENKLIFIDQAVKAGLTVPQSIITNNKKELQDFFQHFPNGIISKPFYFSSHYVEEEASYAIYTTTITKEMIDELPDFFFPSFFQEKVEAAYEIRTFYIDKNFYSTAVFVKEENRNVDIKLSYLSENIFWLPYDLPKNIKEKIIEFMINANLNTGSIDLIKDKKGKYFFIEVNPVGQYTAPSYRCNYYLEKIIAEWLIDQDKKINQPVNLISYENHLS